MVPLPTIDDESDPERLRRTTLTARPLAI